MKACLLLIALVGGVLSSQAFAERFNFVSSLENTKFQTDIWFTGIDNVMRYCDTAGVAFVKQNQSCGNGGQLYEMDITCDLPESNPMRLSFKKEVMICDEVVGRTNTSAGEKIQRRISLGKDAKYKLVRSPMAGGKLPIEATINLVDIENSVSGIPTHNYRIDFRETNFNSAKCEDLWNSGDRYLRCPPFSDYSVMVWILSSNQPR